MSDNLAGVSTAAKIAAEVIMIGHDISDYTRERAKHSLIGAKLYAIAEGRDDDAAWLGYLAQVCDNTIIK